MLFGVIIFFHSFTFYLLLIITEKREEPLVLGLDSTALVILMRVIMTMVRLQSEKKKEKKMNADDDALMGGMPPPLLVREDGRGALDIREVSLECGFLTRSTGSGRFCLGDTECVASVHGPASSKDSRLASRLRAAAVGGGDADDKCTIAVKFRKHKGQRATEEEDAATLLRRALESCVCRRMYPGCAISVFAQMISDDGSALSAALTACAIALVDAGIEMSAFPATASISVRHDGMIFVDPTLKEEKAAKASVRVTTLATHQDAVEKDGDDKLSSVMLDGPLTEEELEGAIAAGTAAALSLRAFVRESCIGIVAADPTLVGFDERGVARLVKTIAKQMLPKNKK